MAWLPSWLTKQLIEHVFWNRKKKKIQNHLLIWIVKHLNLLSNTRPPLEEEETKNYRSIYRIKSHISRVWPCGIIQLLYGNILTAYMLLCINCVSIITVTHIEATAAAAPAILLPIVLPVFYWLTNSQIVSLLCYGLVVSKQ